MSRLLSGIGLGISVSQLISNQQMLQQCTAFLADFFWWGNFSTRLHCRGRHLVKTCPVTDVGFMELLCDDQWDNHLAFNVFSKLDQVSPAECRGWHSAKHGLYIAAGILAGNLDEMTRLFLSESRPHSCFQPNTKSRPELEQGAMDKTKLICMSSPSCETSNDKFLCAGDIQVYSLRNLSDFRKTLRVLQPLWIKIPLFVWACVCLYVCTRTFVCLHECLHDWLIDVCLVGLCGCCGCILSLCTSMWCNFVCLLAWLFVCCCSCASASLYVHSYITYMPYIHLCVSCFIFQEGRSLFCGSLRSQDL